MVQTQALRLGTYPATWQGWGLTLLYVGLIVGMAVWQGQRTDGPDIWWWTIVTVATLVFVGRVWRKTAGGWRWRWDGDADSDAPKRRRYPHHRKPGA